MDVWTEDAIRNYLDGYFVKVYPSGLIREVEVPADHMPSHKPAVNPGGYRHVLKRRTWSEAEENDLIAHRAIGATAKAIGLRFNRTESSIRQRIRMLQSRGVQL